MELDPTHYHLSTQLELHSPILDKGEHSTQLQRQEGQKQVVLLQAQSLNASNTVCDVVLGVEKTL